MNKGQITITSIIGWGLALAVATIGSFGIQGRATDLKIETVKGEATKVVERVAKLEEAVGTIKTDTATIKNDIKMINSKLDQLIGGLKR